MQGLWDMVYNATFNNISVISWRSVLLVEETGENHRPVANQVRCTRYNIIIKFVSDLQLVGGFLRFPPPIKLIAKI
jgi:hypothetical protein